MNDPKLQDLLETTPAICFILTSAFDGEMDPKEIAAFEDAVCRLRNHKNPLVNSVFTAASRRLVSDCEKLVAELGKRDMMVLPSRLMMCRTYAKEIAPDDAPEFFQVLYDLSRDVADAAGGTFGFGNRINRSEQAALGLISAALGLNEKDRDEDESED